MFHFDRVFDEEASQSDVYDEIQPFLQSALDGENVCIFAYGATGSGKTHTMQGPSIINEETGFLVSKSSGILPRAANFIFDEIHRLNKLKYTYKIYFSAFEIYNENIYDLCDKNPKERVSLATFIGKSNVSISNESVGC